MSANNAAVERNNQTPWNLFTILRQTASTWCYGLGLIDESSWDYVLKPNDDRTGETQRIQLLQLAAHVARERKRRVVSLRAHYAAAGCVLQ